jgi:hypothetical protein
VRWLVGLLAARLFAFLYGGKGIATGSMVPWKRWP